MSAPYASAGALGAEPLPPHALDAEQALLGAILHNNEALDLARQHVEPSDFFEDVHRHIFEVMCGRRDAGDKDAPAQARVAACKALLIAGVGGQGSAKPDTPEEALNRRTLALMNRGRAN